MTIIESGKTLTGRNAFVTQFRYDAGKCVTVRRDAFASGRNYDRTG